MSRLQPRTGSRLDHKKKGRLVTPDDGEIPPVKARPINVLLIIAAPYLLILGACAGLWVWVR